MSNIKFGERRLGFIMNSMDMIFRNLCPCYKTAIFPTQINNAVPLLVNAVSPS